MEVFLALVTLLIGCSEYRFAEAPDHGDLGADGTDLDADGSSDTTEGVDTSVPANDETYEGDDSGVDTNTMDTGTDDDSGTDTALHTDTGEIPEDVCDIAVQIAGWLDQYQVAGDGRVFYCHSGSGNYTLIEADISACIPHLRHEWDVFPTTLCDS